MGAIAAVLAANGEADIAIVHRMLVTVPHRGAHVQLLRQGSTLLAVASGYDHPDAWVARQNGLAAAFVGVLDNCEELIRHLRDRGQSVEAPEPADLLLSLFRVFEHDTVRLLRGAFAAIITDGSQLLAFRDHLGFGPLFFREDADSIFIGSEAKQVVAGAGLPLEPDLEVLERIFYDLLDDNLPCALKGARRLPKASLLRVEPGRPLTIERYWHPERLLETAHLSADDIRARFEELMHLAASRVLTGADVISLSGGIDSTAVAAFAAPAHLRLTGRPMRALTQVFPDHPSVDERRYTEMVSQSLGLVLQTYTSSAKQLDDLDQWVRLADGPPLALLPEIAQQQRLVRALGFRTILTGEYGEFVYDMHDALVTHLLAKRRYSGIRQLLRSHARRKGNWKPLVREMIAAFVPGPLAAGYRRLARREGNPRLPDWVDSRLGSRAFYLHNLDVPPQDLWAGAQLVAFHGPGIGSESEEICGTLHGVRIRRPLADVDLWEFFLSLPAEVKFPEAFSKALIRRLLRGKLPDPILDRRDKTYFDEFAVSRIDYAALQRWLLQPLWWQMPGVNYDRLRERVERQDLSLIDLFWVNDLAAIHAFLSIRE